VNFFAPELGNGKLNTQSYHIRNNNIRQHRQGSPEKSLEETGSLANGQIMLVTNIEHPEKQSRDQSNNHDKHGPFGIDAVVNMSSRLGSTIGNKQKSFKTVKNRVKHR
jgi:hypothetical protein